MIEPNDFLDLLSANGVAFFTGVPDSLLKGLLTGIQHRFAGQHYIAANEGAALGLAAGYHLATGKLPLVYLQNSGLGNLINPLTSLADQGVYSIPALLIIGWRGEPGINDEPQHRVMGKITPTILHQLHVPFIVLKKNTEGEWQQAVLEALQLCITESRPVALLIESGLFAEEELSTQNDYELSAEEAIKIIYKQLQPDDIVVCTTGKIGRAFYKINEKHKKIERYFLNVGSMGHAISIATGISMHRKERVILFDGDGALLMHMGALALPQALGLQNLHYILLNNGSHQSVGAQPTLGFHVDFCTIAAGCGNVNPVRAESRETLLQAVENFAATTFLEVRINNESDPKLPRPEAPPKAAKETFMNSLGSA